MMMGEKMNSTQQDTGGKFINGLVVGIVIGATLMFLLSTKKGKKILKMLTEEGLGGVSGIEELLMDGGDEEVYEEVIEEKESKEQKEEHQANGHTQTHHEQPVHATPRITKVRRFFRGVPKRG